MEKVRRGDQIKMKRLGKERTSREGIEWDRLG